MPRKEAFTLKSSDDKLMEALRLISPDQYQILKLFYDSNNPTYQWVADNLAIPVNTVRTRLYRGRGRITRWRQDV